MNDFTISQHQETAIPWKMPVHLPRDITDTKAVDGVTSLLEESLGEFWDKASARKFPFFAGAAEFPVPSRKLYGLTQDPTGANNCPEEYSFSICYLRNVKIDWTIYGFNKKENKISDVRVIAGVSCLPRLKSIMLTKMRLSLQLTGFLHCSKSNHSVIRRIQFNELLAVDNNLKTSFRIMP